MASNLETVGSQFLQFYYTQFQNDRKGLSSVFNDHSMLSFEGEQFMGAANIINKFLALGMQSIAHQVLSTDVQPSPVTGGIIIFVTGALQMDQDAPMKFSQVFILNPTPSGSFYVHNTIFRLNFG
jgi:hypothetical protein